LLITHLPIFGSVLGALVLIHGLISKTNQTLVAAYNLFIISSIGAGVAYYTGEGAEEAVEHLAGVSHDAIEKHEESAVYALTGLVVLGVAAIVGLFVTLKNRAAVRKVALGVLLISLISFSIVARTGYLGGQIRHTEVSDGQNAANIEEEEEESEGIGEEGDDD
jgi:uncharacterized membrane protein